MAGDHRSTPADGRSVHLSGEEARQGRIVLNTRRRRSIFIAGLVGLVLVAVLLGFAA